MIATTGHARRVTLVLALLALAGLAACAGARTPAPAAAPAPPPARCPHCPDTLLAADGTPPIAVTGKLARVDGHVVIDGCAGRVTLEDVQGESVDPLVGHEAWVNGLCTGRGRMAALGGHALGDSVVDLFVMSMCPFGRALEKQMAADIARGDSIHLPPVRVHFILYEQDAEGGPVFYSRHGENELREDVVQMTVREMEPKRFWAYIGARSTSDTTWTSIASRVGLGWRTLTEIERRLQDDVQGRAHAEWLEASLDWPHIDGSPTIFWMGREVKDIADVPGFGRATMPKEQCKN